MIEILSATLAAGVPQRFEINGEYLEVLDAQYPLDLQMTDRNGSILSVMKSAEASFFSRPGKYGAVILQSAQAQAVRVFIGSGDAGTRRISSTVQVVDGGKARTLAGAGFMLASGAGSVAGQYAQANVFNPAGSGVRTVIKAYTLIVQAATPVAAGPILAALGNPTAVYGLNKLPGSAASKSRVYSNSNAAQQISALGYWDYATFPAAGSLVRTLQEPIVLMPGAGIMFESQTVNTAINMAVEFTEESLI